MPAFGARAIVSALTMSSVTTSTSAISLANFTPRVENLPSQCQAVYTTPIQGCRAEDFTTAGATCSNECVSGLVKIMKSVEVACASVDVPETSIIGIFLFGRGIPALCPGIEVITISPSKSSARPIATPTPTPTSSEDELATTTAAEATSTEEPEPTTTTESDVATSTEESTSTVTETTALTTFETSTPPAESSATSSAAAPTTTPNTQLSNVDSGGGSPFDVQAIGAAANSNSLRKLAFSALIGVAGLAFTIV